MGGIRLPHLPTLAWAVVAVVVVVVLYHCFLGRRSK